MKGQRQARSGRNGVKGRTKRATPAHGWRVGSGCGVGGRKPGTVAPLPASPGCA